MILTVNGFDLTPYVEYEMDKTRRNWKWEDGVLKEQAGNYFCAAKNSVCEDFKYCGVTSCIYKKDQQESPYWQNIEAIAKRQREKGMDKYGMRLEDNPLELVKRIEYIEEELVDALMYCDWIKDGLRRKSV